MKVVVALSALYYKAHNEGSLSKNTTILADKETGETSFDQYSSAHIIDEIVNSTVDYIILNKQTTYPDGFVNQMNRLTHVSSKVINQLAVDIHSPKYHDSGYPFVTSKNLGIKLHKVVLPPPEGPTIAIFSPFFIDKFRL